MTTGREVIDVLERYTELDWSKAPHLSSEQQWTYPPAIVFRFHKDRMDADALEKTMSVFHAVISSFHGNVKWTLTYPRQRNWLLIPTRLWDLETSGNFQGEVESKISLSKTDPQFGVDANMDLAKIAEQLAKALESAQVPERDEQLEAHVKKLMSKSEYRGQIEGCLQRSLSPSETKTVDSLTDLSIAQLNVAKYLIKRSFLACLLYVKTLVPNVPTPDVRRFIHEVLPSMKPWQT